MTRTSKFSKRQWQEKQDGKRYKKACPSCRYFWDDKLDGKECLLGQDIMDEKFCPQYRDNGECVKGL